ncbi:MAG: hypothetical protein NTY07_03220 [Bacteroidia bacterium]|nr:hypothetical protein [Bacteroidia bacterium]
MKKQIFYSLIILIALFNAKAYGQNTGDKPAVGSTHGYWVNGSAPGTQTSGVGSIYTWWLSDSPTNLLTPVAASPDFTPGTGYNVPAVNAHSVSLTWNPTSAGKTYYLVVKEEGVAPLCTNIKAYAIQPSSNFLLQYTLLAADGTTSGDNLDRCAPDIAITAAGTAIAYNYGTDSYLFKLSASGVYTSWSFDYSFTKTIGTGTTDTYQYSVDGGVTYLPVTPTTLNIPANASGNQVVLIKATLANGTANEGLTAETLKLSLTNIKDAGGNAVTKITNNAGTDITATPEQTQTVKSRPATSGIQSN